MTFEAPGVSAALSRGRPGANRASFGAPSPSWSSTLDLRKFASRLRARPSYDPWRLCAQARFLPCVEFVCFFLCREGERCKIVLFRKLSFGLRETYTFRAPGAPGRLPGPGRGSPGGPSLAAGRPRVAPWQAPGGPGRLFGGSGWSPGLSWVHPVLSRGRPWPLRAPPGLLLASPGLSPGLSWALLASPGLSWSLLASCGLSWPPGASCGLSWPPGASCGFS